MAKINKISIVSQGRIVLDIDNGKKILLDRDAIQTASLLGINLRTGNEVHVEDSVVPETGEVSETWCRLVV